VSDAVVPIVQATSLTKEFERGQTRIVALDGVDLTVRRGEFLALMGPSGSGKSTLLHLIAGMDKPTGGRLLVLGEEPAGMSERGLARWRTNHIGFVFQSFNLIPTLTAAENIALPMRLAGRKPDAAWLDTVVDTVGLGHRLGHRPSELSGGQQQRVAVARALASRPQIVLADEPTGNLDSRTGAEILAFMRSAVRELGQTIVMVTHDPVAASYADHAVFLADGRIVDELADPTSDSVFDRMKSLGG
jgi:putative ABC transport system ATP-binding protein